MSIERFDTLMVDGLDLMLGWVLLLPRDLGLLAVAVLTSLLLVGVRRWATDQDWLNRVRADQRTLSRLRREAKRAGDRERAARHAALRARISLRKLAAEGKPLLWAIVPVALLAAWCYDRLPYMPVTANEPVALRLYHPASDAGAAVHISPSPELSAEPWLTRFEHAEAQPDAIAQWLVRPGKAGAHTLTLVSPRGRFEHPLHAGDRRPSPQSVVHTDDRTVRSELALEPRRLFGVVPGVPALALPAWLVGYLILTVAMIPVTKRVFRLQ